ncbi:MAG: type II secretion system F family protein [Patescibacteria group bacterium]
MLYKYTVSTTDGQVQQGEVDLGSRGAVIEHLKLQGLTVISVELTEKSAVHRRLSQISFGRIRYVDILLFTKHLSVMLRAGMTLLDSLRALVEQSKTPKYQKVMKQVVEDVEQGNSFSSALAKHERVFSSFYVHVVEAGELSGTLEKNLEHLAGQLVKDFNLRRHVKSALLYPGIVFGAALVIGFFFATYVLPQVSSIFTGLHDINLPFVTRVLLAISSFAREHTLISFLVMVGVVTFGWWLLHRKFIKPVTHYIILHLPIVGSIAKQINMARFALMLGTLLHSGLDIVRALEITREVIDNVYYKRVIAEAHRDMQRGISLKESLMKEEDFFPNMVLHMIDVGERSGELEGVLLYLAEFYEQEVDSTMKNLSSILEPVLLLFIGLVAMGLAYAILIPIYNYISAIRDI